MRLESQAHKLPGQLSGGQQQRVAIARATVIEPPLVLMDEPLSNLDAKLRLEMRAEIRRIHDLVGSTTIYVTHDQDEALSLADRIVVLRDGRVRQIGTPTELYARPAHADVAEFMGYRNIIPARASSGGNGVLRVAVGGCRADRARLSMRREGDVVVAFRPDDLTPRADGPLAAKVVTAEYRGRDFFGKAAMTGGTELYFRSDEKVGAGRYDPPRRRRLARAHLCRGRGMSTISIPSAAERSAEQRLPLRLRLAQRGLDGVTLLVLPAVSFLLALFVYPFLYGLVLSFEPKEGGWLANYQHFFSEPFLYTTISKTLWLAIPATLINILVSVPVAMRVRLMRRQRLLTTILVVPITLGTVLIAEGLLNYLGPQGWVNRTLMAFGLISSPIRLVHNYWGTLISLFIIGVPVHLPADAVLCDRHRSVAGTGGGDARRQARARGSATSSCRCCCPASPSPSA